MSVSACLSVREKTFAVTCKSNTLQPSASCSHTRTRASVNKHYSLVPFERQRCPTAGKVTVGPSDVAPLCVTDLNGLSNYASRPNGYPACAFFCCMGLCVAAFCCFSDAEQMRCLRINYYRYSLVLF